MDVLFRCGHSQSHDERSQSQPVCTSCGSTFVARVENVAPPRFRGVARGPHCEFVALPAIAVSLAPTIEKE